jgi:hypothetical protein
VAFVTPPLRAAYEDGATRGTIAPMSLPPSRPERRTPRPLAPRALLVSRTRALGVAALTAAALLVHHDAGAVGTRVFELDTLDKLSGGDLKGVAVSSDGMVRAGFTLGNVTLPDSTAVYASLTLADGSVLVGTSPNGKVFRVEGDRATLYADTKQTVVTSLAQGANGAVYAGTIPEGKVFKIADGKADVFATVPDAKHVWALAFDKARTTLFAAVGPDGRVVRIAADGSSSVYFQTDETNLVSVAVGEGGEVYAGSQGKALLYKISGPGRATVLYDMPGEEVKGIAIAKGGVVYATSNEYGEPPEVPKRSAAAAHAPAGPESAPRPKPGKGTLYRFDATGRPERMMHHDDFHYLALAVGDDGQPYVGTGAEGRVYTVDDAHVVTLVADTDERQVGALAVGGPGKGYVVSGDPAVFHRIVARGGPEAVWTSKVLDAGLRAKFGVLSWRASGALEMSTRTGNTGAPDATWSPWSPALAQPGGVASPLGRYVQVRGRWSKDAAAVLTDVTLPFVTENVRPVILEVSATTKGLTREPIKENLPASGSARPKHDATVKLSWKVDNADNDALRYRVSFKREGQTLWRDALKPEEELTTSEYEWETDALPEGKYRVRVEASDEAANPPGTVLKHALESQSILVDNTPPTIAALTITGRRLRARVTDGAGPIARVELTIDGKDTWHPLAAADGVLDTADEAIDSDVSALVPPGSHIVALRAFDAAGNAVTREVETP